MLNVPSAVRFNKANKQNSQDNPLRADNRPKSTVISNQSPNTRTTKLEPGDFDRIKEYEALPRACILKNLIQQRR